MDLPMHQPGKLGQLFSGRRGRNLREYFTAYLMIGPAMLLIFVFGIFPVGFAVYVSLHKWLLVQSDFRGLINYFNAIDNLTYLGLFVMSVGALWLVYRNLKEIYQQSREVGNGIWLLSLPGAIYAAVVVAGFRWAYFQLPEFLDIANKMRGLERTRELFVTLLSEAFQAETVFPHWQSFVQILIIALIAGAAAVYFGRIPDNSRYQFKFMSVWLAGFIGLSLLQILFASIEEVYAMAVETGEDPGIWPQMIMILSGVLLLFLAWRLWVGAAGQASTTAFALRLMGSIALMVGAVMLIIEIPTIVASGDKDLWEGLRVTIFFSLGTVPIQLTIAMFLAVILFQRIKGADFFRILFFLPYVTPAVASATMFRYMFSERASGPINSAFQWLGGEPQQWLREPDGIITIIARSLGFVDYPASMLPSWMSEDLGMVISDWIAGPSMALTVIISFSIWSFVGYNVVIYLAGLGNIPSELTEAAEIDGANKWGVFRHITFPLLSPTTYFLSLIAVIGTFKAFNTIWIMRTGQALGSVDTFSVLIFDEFFTKSRYGYASALAFVLFAVILSLTYINNKVQGARVFYG